MTLTRNDGFLICLVITSFLVYLFATSDTILVSLTNSALNQRNTIVRPFPWLNEGEEVLNSSSGESSHGYPQRSGEEINVTVSTVTEKTALESIDVGLDEDDCKKKILRGTQYTVLYNVMPKTGSRTFTGVARKVIEAALRRNGQPERSIKLVPKNSDVRGNATLLEAFYKRSTRTSSLIRGHSVFVQPPSSHFICMNTIREPIPRMVSAYYFASNGDKASTKAGTNISFDECVANNMRKCQPSASHYLRYFCGDSPQCQTDEALQIAKDNLDTFLVVGLTEEFPATMRVIEKLMPDFFKGLAREYDRMSKKLHNQFSTKRKIGPTKETIEKLRQNHDVKLMYEFYEYAASRFHRLKKCLLGET